MEKEDLENIDLQEDTAKVKNKRKVLRKVKRKKSKRNIDEEKDKEPSTEDIETLENYQVLSNIISKKDI